MSNNEGNGAENDLHFTEESSEEDEQDPDTTHDSIQNDRSREESNRSRRQGNEYIQSFIKYIILFLILAVVIMAITLRPPSLPIRTTQTTDEPDTPVIVRESTPVQADDNRRYITDPADRDPVLRHAFIGMRGAVRPIGFTGAIHYQNQMFGDHAAANLKVIRNRRERKSSV